LNPVELFKKKVKYEDLFAGLQKTYGGGARPRIEEYHGGVRLYTEFNSDSKDEEQDFKNDFKKLMPKVLALVHQSFKNATIKHWFEGSYQYMEFDMNEKALANLKIGQSLVIAGHSTVTFFSKSKDYDKALKDLAKYIKEDRLDNGRNGDWQGVDGRWDKNGMEFKTEHEAENWAQENVRDYASYALKVLDPPGWLFAADIHH
jgi:hypothetical protein